MFLKAESTSIVEQKCELDFILNSVAKQKNTVTQKLIVLKILKLLVLQ